MEKQEFYKNYFVPLFTYINPLLLLTKNSRCKEQREKLADSYIKSEKALKEYREKVSKQYGENL